MADPFISVSFLSVAASTKVINVPDDATRVSLRCNVAWTLDGGDDTTAYVAAQNILGPTGGGGATAGGTPHPADTWVDQINCRGLAQITVRAATGNLDSVYAHFERPDGHGGG